MPFFRRIKSRYNSTFKTYICKRFFKNYFQVLNTSDFEALPEVS